MQFKLNIIQLTIILYILVFLSIFSVLSGNQFFISLNCALYVYFILHFICLIKGDKLFKLILIILTIITLSTLTSSWDARSIWVFKTKIFYHDSNIFNIKDLPLFSHPTYPILAPIFASIFIKSLNIWNEILPKVGFTLLFFPPLIYLYTRFKNEYLYALLSVTIFIVGKYFFNGEMDGLVSVYFSLSLLLSFEIILLSEKCKSADLLILFFNNILLSLLKFEGTVLSVLIFCVFFITYFLTKKIKFRNLCLIAVSIIPSILWMIYVNKINISHNIGDSSFSLINFTDRVVSIQNYIIILKYFFSDNKFLTSIILSLILYLKYYKNNQFLKLTFIVNFSYLIILTVIYLSTNFDLEWHLNSSSNRVIKPLSLSFMIISLYYFQSVKIINSK